MRGGPPKLASRRIWGDRQHFLTVPREFRHRNVALIYTQDFILIVPVKELSQHSPCHIVREVVGIVCPEARREAVSGGE